MDVISNLTGKILTISAFFVIHSYIIDYNVILSNTLILSLWLVELGDHPLCNLTLNKLSYLN